MAQRVDDILSEIGKGGGLADSNLYRIKLPTINGENRGIDILCTDISLQQTNYHKRSSNGDG